MKPREFFAATGLTKTEVANFKRRGLLPFDAGYGRRGFTLEEAVLGRLFVEARRGCPETGRYRPRPGHASKFVKSGWDKFKRNHPDYDVSAGAPLMTPEDVHLGRAKVRVGGCVDYRMAFVWVCGSFAEVLQTFMAHRDQSESGCAVQGFETINISGAISFVFSELSRFRSA